MRPLSASQLLALWEHGLAQPFWQRALSLLAAALPDLSLETLANLPLGQRDACLLTLREHLFGPRLTSLATCPACGERLEVSFNVDDIQVGRLPASNGEPVPGASAAGPDEEKALEEEGMLFLSIEGYEVTFRLPNSLDLAEIDGVGTAERARQILLGRCLLSARENGMARTAADLPVSVTQAISERMASVDPQGDVQIALTCPNCAHAWQSAFDPLAFIWAEISAWAQRILREVHLLAGAYGWRESDILALSPGRRKAYLQMVMRST